MQDKRKHKRFEVRWKAALVFSGATKKPIFHTLTHDLSVNGTSVQNNADEPVNTVLTMLLIPPAINGVAQKVIKLKSVVMSSRPFRNGFRLGLSFIHDPELEKLWQILNGMDLSGDTLPSDPDIEPAEPAAPVPAAAPATAAAPALSVLEMIKLKAAEKKAAEAQNTQSKEELQKQLFKKISDSLMAAFTYFTDLAKNLDELKPAYPQPYPLPNAGDIKELSWQEGRTNCIARPAVEGTKIFHKISLNYELGNREPIKLVRDSHSAQKTEIALKEAGFEFSDQVQRNANGVPTTVTFTVQRRIRVALAFSCDDETGKIFLETRNLERFGNMKFEFELDALNQNLLDQLTLMIMGEANTFSRMVKRVL